MDQSEQIQQQQHVNGIPVSMPAHPRAASTSQEAQRLEHQQQRLESFWADQMQEAEQATDFKNHMLPLARVKKIMKADEDVRMISLEAPVVFAKACEMFISELTLRAWMHTEEIKRKTLQKNDIAEAISGTETFDFLVDILPRDEFKEETYGSSTEPIPYYYLPQATSSAGAAASPAYGAFHALASSEQPPASGK